MKTNIVKSLYPSLKSSLISNQSTKGFSFNSLNCKYPKKNKKFIQEFHFLNKPPITRTLSWKVLPNSPHFSLSFPSNILPQQLFVLPSTVLPFYAQFEAYIRAVRSCPCRLSACRGVKECPFEENLQLLSGNWKIACQLLTFGLPGE